MRGREEFATSVHESLFERGIFKPIERTSGDKEQIGAAGHQALMSAK